MHILIGLTYYRPHYSGLTIYTERLARALVEKGHQVTVLTSRFNSSLPISEEQNGVKIIRLGVLFRVSKGVIMPAMPFRAYQQILQADIVNLHVPQLDAAPVSILSRLVGRPIVLTYHCDLHLPSGLVHQVANQVSHLANHISARTADRIVTNTRDYAEHSPFLKNYLGKVHVIPPPVVLSPVEETDVRDFREKFGVRPGQKIIGMAARLATEKGVEYLIDALPTVLERHPEARVLFVGQHQNVLGEEAYAARLAPLIDKLGDHWTFLGVLNPTELTVFFRECAVTVLPSINGTESFGMVQVEAMSCGTPVVASDLPGVRQPVSSTGMGRIVPPRDSRALARALNELLDNPGKDCRKADEIILQYNPATIAGQYEALFGELIARR